MPPEDERPDDNRWPDTWVFIDVYDPTTVAVTITNTRTIDEW